MDNLKKSSRETVFLNGKFLDPKEARVSVLAPGFLYGWGLFETMRYHNGRVVYFDMHLERIRRSCPLLGMKFPCSVIAVKKAIKKAVEVNGGTDVYVRLTLWRAEKGTDLAVIAKKYRPYPGRKYRNGFCACISSFKQNENSSLANIKTTSYLLYRLAFSEAQKKGFDEALILNQRGYIAEASRSNLFLVKDEEIFTPSLECGCLSGITRRAALDLAQKYNIKIDEGNLTQQDLRSADEAFLTNSLVGIMPLTSLEKIPIGNGRCGKLTRFFIERYNSLLK